MDALATTRRLRALAHDRWSCRALADRSGYAHSTLAAIRSGRTSRVDALIADDVDDLYRALDGHLGPAGPGGDQAANLARSNGWRPRWHWQLHPIDPAPADAHAPLGDAEPDLVLAVLAGTRRLDALPAAHRWIPLRSLLAQELPVVAIALRVHTSTSEVRRILGGLDDVLAHDPTTTPRVDHHGAPGDRGAA